jgi:hypothetical protein
MTERLDLILVPDNFLRHKWTIEASHDLRLAIGQDLIIGGTKSSDAIQYCIIMANISNFVSTIAGDRIAVNWCSKEFDELKKENNTGGMDRELPCRSTHGGWRRSCWGQHWMQQGALRLTKRAHCMTRNLVQRWE